MEELIIERGWYAGKVVIDHLPQTMRLLLLFNDQITKAYIGELPPSIHLVMFFRGSMWAPLKLSKIAGEVTGWGDRVGTMHSRMFSGICKMSHWYSKFSKKNIE